MSMRNAIISHNNEFNKEVGGDSTLYFTDATELSQEINELEEDNKKAYYELEQSLLSGYG